VVAGMAVMPGIPYAGGGFKRWGPLASGGAGFWGKIMILAAPATLLTALVTLLAILVTIGTAILVARVRRATGIFPPAMSGDPRVERALRVQGNTMEGFIAFLPALWLAALYFQGWIPPIIGLVWCLGRIAYAVGYMQDANRR